MRARAFGRGALPLSAGLWLAPSAVSVLKVVVAATTAALLASELLLRRWGRPDAMRRGRDALLLVLGLLGILGWWSFLSLPGLVHHHDAYHYFLGARYFPELGYTRLYVCSVVADVEAGLGDDLPRRRVRNLETNLVERGSELAANPAACKVHFTPERWRAFSDDVAWFRGQLSPLEWRRLQLDHGFNGSPVWLLAGSFFAGFSGGAERWVAPLALLDVGLLGLLWIGVAHAFGWRAACVAAVFWGTNGFADFTWTGGSFLRQDWLVALVLSIACLRRGRPAWAGALATLSTLLRVFPGVAVLALALKALLRMRTAGSYRPSRAELRFSVGCILTLLLLVPLATLGGGSGSWSDFVSNSRKHLATPLLNQMGLRAIVSYDVASRASVLEKPEAADPYLVWKLAQRRHFAERWWIFAGAAAIYATLLAGAVAKQEDWVALALGVGAIPIVTGLTCYYHAALVGLALLWVARQEAGVALCVLAAISSLIAGVMGVSDEAFVWMSVAELLAVFYVTAGFANESRKQPLGVCP
jgi:hypothetical protein